MEPWHYSDPQPQLLPGTIQLDQPRSQMLPGTIQLDQPQPKNLSFGGENIHFISKNITIGDVNLHQLKKDIDEIREMVRCIYYAPGMPGSFQAETSFNNKRQRPL